MEALASEGMPLSPPWAFFTGAQLGGAGCASSCQGQGVRDGTVLKGLKAWEGEVREKLKVLVRGSIAGSPSGHHFAARHNYR